MIHNHPFSYLLNLLINWSTAHPGWATAIMYWLYNDIVDSMPEPNGNKFYQFVYMLLNKIAGNLSVAVSSKAAHTTNPAIQNKQGEK
jgi:hypothetical protein